MTKAPKAIIPIIFTEAIGKSIRLLLHGNCFQSFQEAVVLWRDTFEYRQNILKDADAQKEMKSLLRQWKVLTFSQSHILVISEL